MYKNCAELYKAGKRISGVYTINPDNDGAFDVYCDQKTAGGGWTVFQKRLDGSLISTSAGTTTNEALEIWMVSFGLDWTRFTAWQKNEAGFMWILKTQLEKQAKTAYSECDFFGVASERSKYKLSLGTYSGKSCKQLQKEVIEI